MTAFVPGTEAVAPGLRRELVYTMNTKNAHRDPKAFAASVGRALRRASHKARKTARAYGTPVYFWKNGKVVAEKP